MALASVEALPLLAAARRAGVRREPAPVVRQTAPEDACFRYTCSLASSALPYFLTSSTRLFRRTGSLE